MGKPRSVVKKLDIKPGYLVIDNTTATGGVTYDRSSRATGRNINRGRGVERRIVTKKVVDHTEMVEAIDALVKRAYHLCRSYCSNIGIGWMIDEVGLKRLEHEFEALRAEAEELNELAARSNCARRVVVELIPAQLNFANADTVRAIARHICGVLKDIHAALRHGAVKKIPDYCENELHAPMLKAKNLDQLAVSGQAGDTISFALETIPLIKKEILQLLREGYTPAEAGEAVNLDMIEAAITWFEDNRVGRVYTAEDAEAAK